MRPRRIDLQFSFFLWIILSFFQLMKGKVHDPQLLLKNALSPDRLRNYLTEIMARNASFHSCPAPHFPQSKEDCSVPTCTREDDCSSKNQSCCFNGCVFTCVNKITPPPVIDWDNEPEAPTLRKEGEAVLRCTTSPRPAPSEPVGCPKGYVCQIEDHGDALERRFNSGKCVPESTTNQMEPESPELATLKENTRKQTVYLPGGCVLSESQFKSMQDFMNRPYVKDCLCVAGSVECRVSA